MIAAIRAAASRFAALLLAVLVVYALYAGVVAPLLGRLAIAKEDIETQRNLLSRLQSTPALSAARSGAAAGLAHAEIAPGRVFLPGESHTIRTAGLQSSLADKAAAAGIRIQSAHTVETERRGPVELVGVEIQFQSALPELQRLLFDLERAEPYLFVESLRVGRAPDAAVRAGKDLDVRLVAAGATPHTRIDAGTDTDTPTDTDIDTGADLP